MLTIIANIIAITFILFGIVLFFKMNKINIIKFKIEKNDFFSQEANRYFNKNCEIDKEHDFQGKIVTKGLEIRDGKLVKQAKLCDISILS